MIRPPYTARVAAGLLVTVVEESKKLPTYAVTLPMTAVSQVLQAGMRMQQNVAELAIKGDTVLDGLFHQNEEQPSWARFDEDEDPAASVAAPASGADSVGSNDTGRDGTGKDDSDNEAPSKDAAGGRFALYSSTPKDVTPGTTSKASATDSGANSARPNPEADSIVEALDYDSLTLAQVRAQIRTLGVDDLQELAAHEKAGRNRTPFVTMLENRVAAKSDQ